MNLFKGLSLEPTDAFKNIATLIDAGVLFSISDDVNLTEAADIILDAARDYACVAGNLLTSPTKNTKELSQQPSKPNIPPATGTIGERIRELRKMHNLTLKDIAEATGVTQQAVHLWESKGAIPSCDKLIPLANALECDPLWLIGK